MLNHLITSYRFLRKSTTYTLINLSGLVLGLSAAFILLIITINQLTYNQAIPDAGRVYRVLSIDQKRNITEAVSPVVLSGLFKDRIPCIEKTGIAVRLCNFADVRVGKTNIFFEEPGMLCANPELLDVLGVKFIDRQNNKVLRDSSGIIISRSLAKKYFGSGDAQGRTLRLNINGTVYLATIEAVFMDFPWNSSFSADIIGSLGLLKQVLAAMGEDPGLSLASFANNYSDTYIRLTADSKLTDLLRQSAAISRMPEVLAQRTRYIFQPVGQVFLNSEAIQNDLVRKGNKDDLFVYTSLAIFILFLAGVNYSILSTARSALRFREVGVRKVMGATRSNLRAQILTESVLLTFVAFPLSFILLGLILPLLEPWFGAEIRMYPENIHLYLPVFIIITLVIGFISGAYVAFFLASMDPLEALKSKFFSYKKFSLSKIFIVFQLFITLALMIGVINVYRQINFCLTQNESTRKENLLKINCSEAGFAVYEKFKAELIRQTSVIAVTGASINPPSAAAVMRSVKLPGKSVREVSMEITYIDYNFFRTMGIPFLSGTELGKTMKKGEQNIAYINNEAKTIIQLKSNSVGTIGNFKIKGVTSDFNFHTMHSRVAPSLFILDPGFCSTVICRFNSDDQEQVIRSARNIWKKLAPGKPFDYSLYDQKLSEIYEREQNFGRIVGAFTLLAFIITGMGLFGLAMLLSERRMKEMAIRKIFGASNADIIYQMQKEFFIYIGLAALIAMPMTWYLMNLWLEEFYYRITLHWLTFAVSLLAVTTFVSLILLIRTRKVINENPINALKYE
jgi:putative ABC transport system permease protein